MSALKVVIFCGYKIRELDSLLILKKQLEKDLSAKVYIIGGLSELQRMEYLLYRIKPDVVFISQIVEHSCRRLSSYALQSKSKVYVVPAEITVITIIEQLLLNPDIKYSHLFTKYLLPGNRYQRLLAPSDIDLRKTVIVGSPKIDCLVREEGSQFLSRKAFSAKYDLDISKRNIFVFTSFVKAREEYLRSDPCFDRTVDQLLESNKCIDVTIPKYLTMIADLSKSFPNYNIILKPHPLEDHTVYESLQFNNFYVIKNEPFYSCLKSIDVAIHWSSTIGPECWIKGVPTIQFAPYKKYDKFLSESVLGNPLVRSSAELKKYIIKYLHHKMEPKFKHFQTKYIKDNFYKLDGNAVKRISSVVKRDTQKSPASTRYIAKHSWSLLVMLAVESILGYGLTQRLMGFIMPNYNWKIAIENHIYLE